MKKPKAYIGDQNHKPKQVTRKEAAGVLRNYRQYGTPMKAFGGGFKVYSFRACRPVIIAE